ncbi:hypothetical protein NMY22_g2874 [Coprinellus aureogranulatus]|nr:hypothetical protein NMY22_g2874 [Coprinellus aureogranulatus]
MDCLLGLSHLLGSNDTPTISDVPVILDIIGQVDKEVERVEAHLAELKDKRHQCQALFSPLRRVPMDLLGEIFSHTVELAGSISNAAYATHRLWSSIEIDLSEDWKAWDRAEKLISRSGTVRKSLSVRAPSGDACNPQGRGTFHAIPTGSGQCWLAHPRLVRLLAEGPPIHNLSISCPASKCLHALFRAVEAVTKGPGRPWDGIKSLKVTVREAWTEGPVRRLHFLSNFSNPLTLPEEDPFGATDIQSFFKSLPPVTRFHLNTPGPPRPHTGDKFPYIPAPPAFLSRLTSLSLDNDWDGDALPRVLQGCHQGNLEELTFGCKSRYVEYLNTQWHSTSSEWVEGICGNSDRMFVLPKLRILRFRELHPDAFKITLFFKAPSLTELELGFDDIGNPDLPSDEQALYAVSEENITADLPYFIEISGCQESFKRLWIHGDLKLRMHDLEVWLDENLLPSLSHLTYNGVYLPAEFFDSLRNRRPRISLERVKTIELLNLPAELHSIALHHRDLRERVHRAWDRRPCLADTRVTITLREREE